MPPGDWLHHSGGNGVDALSAPPTQDWPQQAGAAQPHLSPSEQSSSPSLLEQGTRISL